MNLFGWTLTLQRKAVAAPADAGPLTGFGSGGWWPVIREPFTGAWQQNAEIKGETALAYWAVFACTTLIASDIGKMRLRLVAQDDAGVWTETTNPAYSPVLRKPNRYQTTLKFVEQWITSKLTHGNAYVLKERDARGVVKALYVLDPRRVTVLIAPDGEIYYELNRPDQDLTGLMRDGAVVVPRSEIIHDPMVTLFHSLVGVTPLYACGLAAVQGLTIQTTSNKFFEGGSQPGGVIMIPDKPSDEFVQRIKNKWDTGYSGENIGKIAVLTEGMKYQQLSISATDAQLIEQLRWTAETICACYHVPFALIDSSKGMPDNPEAMVQQYYSQCLQTLTASLEAHLDDGLDLGSDLGTEFDVDDLVWMDTATKTKAAADTIGAGALSPNEARLKYFGMGKVKGGDSPMVQQQYYSLAALAERDADQPFAKPTPATPPASSSSDRLALADDTAADDESNEEPRE
jgi:HK97 family phage portal protein